MFNFLFKEYVYVCKSSYAMSVMVNILNSMFTGQKETNLIDFHVCLPFLEVSHHKECFMSGDYHRAHYSIRLAGGCKISSTR
jgi:hypothetical protein